MRRTERLIKDLSSLECILFDFDDTLYCHSKHGDSDESTADYIANVIKKGSCYWDDSGFCGSMYDFIHYIISLNPKVHFGLIGGVECSVIGDAKLAWVSDNYDIEISNYCTCSQEIKSAVAEGIIKANNFNPSKVLFVDDMWQNLDAFEKLNCMTATPLEIAEFMYRRGISPLSK